MFSVKPTGGTEFVEDDGLAGYGGGPEQGSFLFNGSFPITEKDRLDVFPFRSWTHNPGSFPPSISGNINYESTIPLYSATR